jgi:rubrerythrin
MATSIMVLAPRIQKRFDDPMQLSKEELIQLLKEQKDLELVAVKSYSSFAEKSNNNVVKLLLLGVMHDSMKHAQVLDALISLTQSPIFGNVEQFEVTRGVEEHLKIEEEMLRKISEIIERTDDKEVKSILSQIAMEEKRHHQTLIELKEMVQKIESPKTSYGTT